MTRADELPEIGEGGICYRCGTMVEPAELLKCVSCARLHCKFCLYRMGGKDYCSRSCGEAIFFGDTDDEDPEDE